MLWLVPAVLLVLAMRSVAERLHHSVRPTCQGHGGTALVTYGDNEQLTVWRCGYCGSIFQPRWWESLVVRR